MPYWLTFIAKPTGHLDTFLVPINKRQMALGVATLLIDDAGKYQKVQFLKFGFWPFATFFTLKFSFLKQTRKIADMGRLLTNL